MSKKLFALLSFVALCFGVTFTLADDVKDAVDADPERYTVEFENDKVRVIRVKYGPGEKSVMHSHGPTVVVALTTNENKMTLPDGSSETSNSVAGSAVWADAGAHLPENLSDDPLEVVLVELKE